LQDFWVVQDEIQAFHQQAIINNGKFLLRDGDYNLAENLKNLPTFLRLTFQMYSNQNHGIAKQFNSADFNKKILFSHQRRKIQYSLC
jgi:hypothetical protein